MGGRPGWNKEYWKRMDKETERKLRTVCPKCGSSLTYYNKKFRVWRCGSCEHSWVISGMTDDTRPWWKKLLRIR